MRVYNEEVKKFLNGVKIKIPCKDEVYRIYYNDTFMGTGIVLNNFLKRDIVEINFFDN